MPKRVVRLLPHEERCGNCKHFCPHYIRQEYTLYNRTHIAFVEIGLGHCTYPRLKHRDVYGTCKHFSFKIENAHDDK